MPDSTDEAEDFDDSPIGVPDGIQPIVAYRLWWADSDGHLYALNGTPWAGPGWHEATCLRDPACSEVPTESCSCGFYALRTLEMASFGLFQQLLAGPPPEAWALVCGGVELAGKVIEHADGFRAARARIAEIYPLHAAEQFARTVAATYDVQLKGPLGRIERYFGRRAATGSKQEIWLLALP